MTEREPIAIGFDIETASAEKLYAGGHEGPFVRLVGLTYADDDPRQSVTESAGHYPPQPFRASVEALTSADYIYGHNIFRFDIPALARHCGADYDALCAKAWDTAVLGRLIEPPGAKHETKAGYYSLDAMAKRYGHTGKSDDLAALALLWGPQILCEGCTPTVHRSSAKHEDDCKRKKYYTLDNGVRTEGRMSAADREILGYERIPQDNEDYREYLRGDLAATAFVRRATFDRVENWPYAAREMKVAAIQNRMTFNGWRVNRETLKTRVRQEDERRELAIALLCDDYGLPSTKADGTESAAPWATNGGRLALEEAFHAAGAEYLPRTKTGALAIGKEPMGDGYWVNSEGRRVPGMMNPEAYGTLPAVAALCGVLAEATGATAKYAEIQRYVTNQGRVHGGIGEDQASGRWAMTRPSLTNLGKRGEKVEQRAPFIPEWGHVHIACDASQVDMRAIAGLSQDPAYMKLFGFDENGKPRDAHEDMAEVYFGSRSKEARGRTKGINHKVNYGGSAASTAAMNGLPLQLVVDALAERARAYGRLIEWTQEVRDLGSAGHLLDNGFGRMMRCDPQRAYTQAPALMGQGAARDLICEALLRLVRFWPEVTPYLRAVVHDEVVLSVPEAEADLWTSRLREAFTFEWRDVPILCDVTQPGRDWAECYAGE